MLRSKLMFGILNKGFKARVALEALSSALTLSEYFTSKLLTCGGGASVGAAGKFIIRSNSMM
jgi:hypothetical protein